MSRSKVLIAIVLVAGCIVLAVAAISGSWGAASSDAATATTGPTTSVPGDATTTVPSDPVAVPSSEPAPTTAPDATPNPAAQPSPVVTTTTTAPDEASAAQPPHDTIEERHRVEVAQAADELLVEMLPVVANVDADEPIDVVAQLDTIASEAVLSEVEADRLELEAEGWSRSGTYRVDGIEVLDYTESGESASATVRACLDASEIVVRRADGSVVEPGEGSQRAWNVYVLERTEDAWRLVGRTFTDDPAC